MIYKGKDLKDFDLWDLQLAMTEFASADAKREEASKHHKFDKIKNDKALTLPPVNPEYLKLKDAIKQEIESRKNVHS